MNDIHGNIIKISDQNVNLESLGVSLNEAFKQKLFPVPDDLKGQIEELMDKVAKSVGIISSIRIDVTTDETGEPHAEGLYQDGELALTLYNIKGDKGDTGASAYKEYVDSVPEGEPVMTPEEWLASLRGETGKSAYDIAVENGFVGTVDEWLQSLKMTYEQLTPEQKAEIKGDKGDPLRFEDLTPEQKAELQGEPGKPGKDGTITNLEQTLNPSTTSNAPSSKAVADYVSTHGGTNIKAGSNITLEPQADGSIKINAQLSGGTAQAASQVSYDNADGSQTNVQAKLDELERETKGDGFEDNIAEEMSAKACRMQKMSVGTISLHLSLLAIALMQRLILILTIVSSASQLDLNCSTTHKINR